MTSNSDCITRELTPAAVASAENSDDIGCIELVEASASGTNDTTSGRIEVEDMTIIVQATGGESGSDNSVKLIAVEAPTQDNTTTTTTTTTSNKQQRHCVPQKKTVARCIKLLNC